MTASYKGHHFPLLLEEASISSPDVSVDQTPWFRRPGHGVSPLSATLIGSGGEPRQSLGRLLRPFPQIQA
ncbi:MAG TPA: hypothetical protein VMY18_12365 [Acidobacteriota bacterium]|nr:hypothetical protein [Acidobacteriota bacterium]